MLLNKTFYQGQSLTIGVLIADTYDTASLQSSAIIVGEKKITSTVINQMLRFELSSEDTRNFITSKTVNLVIDDAYFGRREYPLGSLSFEKTKGQTIDASIDEGYTVVFNATINEVAITIDSIMYDYVKGEKGDMADLPAGTVIDPNYVHTDNNYTDAYKAKVDGAIQTETDPTVPAWAKEPTKPTYTASEVGAEPIKGSGDNYVTDAEKTKLSNLSGTNTGDQDLSGFSPIGHTHPYEPANHTTLLDKNTELTNQHLDTTTEKTTPIDADSFGLWDSVTSTFKRLSVANMLTWFRGLPHTFTQMITFSSGVKTDTLTKINGSGAYVSEDGGTIWHTTKWFTPTGTFSSNGTTVTTTDGKLTSAMIGAKIGTVTDKRIITAVANSNSCTVNSDFSQNYSGIVSDSWGVYNSLLSIINNNVKISTRNNTPFIFNDSILLEAYLSTNHSITAKNDGFIAANNGAYFIKNGTGGNYGIRIGCPVQETDSYSYIDKWNMGVFRLGIAHSSPETTLDVNGTTTLRDYLYQNNGTHTGDAVGDRRFKVVNGVLVTQGCTGANATRGLGTWVNVGVQLSDNTATASLYFEGCKRYRKDSNNSYEETCMQSGSNTYDWVIIKQNTWS